MNAGVLVVTADDPGMFSSQNEQDNRYYARLAKMPILEPADSQEAKDFVRIGLDISERFDEPVILRTVMRVSHSSSPVELGERTYDDAAPTPKMRAGSPQVRLDGRLGARAPAAHRRLGRPSLRNSPRRPPSTGSSGGTGASASSRAGSWPSTRGRCFRTASILGPRHDLAHTAPSRARVRCRRRSGDRHRGARSLPRGSGPPPGDRGRGQVPIFLVLRRAAAGR